MVPGRIGLGLGILLAALAGTGPTARAAEPALVKVGILNLVSDAGIFAAIEKGYFQDEGIRVELERFTGASKMMPALVAGELDVAGGTAAASLFNAVASGMDFKVVADKGQTRPGHEFLTLVVRKDLLESGAFRSLADLKGRRIALLGGSAAASHFTVGRILAHAAIPWAGVERVEVAAPNQVALLANRQVDAAMMAEPFAARAERAGAGRRYPLGAEVKSLERIQVAVIMYSGKFGAGRRDVAKRWMAAYVKGLRFVSEKGITGEEVLGLLIRYVRATAEDLRAAAPPYLAPDGRPDVASLAAQQDWYAQMGFVEKKVPLEKVVDLGFLP